MNENPATGVAVLLLLLVFEDGGGTAALVGTGALYAAPLTKLEDEEGWGWVTGSVIGTTGVGVGTGAAGATLLPKLAVSIAI